MKTQLYNEKAEVIGEAELSDSVFGVPFNSDLVHQVMRVQLTNQRKNVAHAKGRSEVRGGGKKPWPQKGTGRSRHGSSRSPIWKGGGVTHGPTKEKNYERAIPKKMRRAAVLMVLSKKVKDEQLKVIDEIKLSQPKTKEAAAVLDRFLKDGKKRKGGLLVLPLTDKNIFRASRNYPSSKTIEAGQLNVLDLLKYKYLLVLKDSLPVIEKNFSAKSGSARN